MRTILGSFDSPGRRIRYAVQDEAQAKKLIDFFQGGGTFSYRIKHLPRNLSLPGQIYLIESGSILADGEEQRVELSVQF
jgi:hypothetical protein